MQEAREVSCPHCGGSTVFFIDPSEGVKQELIEDCQICCRPIVFHVDLTEATARIDAEAQE